MGADRTLDVIWRKRSKAFREETLPYFRYMGQSGFPAFLSLIVISSAIGYISLIHNLPVNFPIAATGVISLMLVLCWSPLRTWLAAGDTVFMMPREVEMDSYLRLSFRYTTIGCSLLGFIVFLLYLPIYNQGSAISGGWLLAAAALLLKAGNVWGAWRERRMAWASMRRLLRVFRWTATAIVLTVWLTCLVWQAFAFMALIGLLFAFMYRLPSSHRLPWERLIAEESRTRKRYYAFFGLFIDVPTLSSTITNRRYLSWLLRIIPYSNANTYVYLYTSSLVRTEIGGIVIRLLLLGALVIFWLADAVSLSGWGSASVFGLFMGLLAVQLGGLRHVHRYSVWKHVYPLPEKQFALQYVKVDLAAVSVCAAVLWLFMAIPLALAAVYIPSVVSAVVIVSYIAIRPQRVRKKMVMDADEE